MHGDARDVLLSQVRWAEAKQMQGGQQWAAADTGPARCRVVVQGVPDATPSPPGSRLSSEGRPGQAATGHPACPVPRAFLQPLPLLQGQQDCVGACRFGVAPDGEARGPCYQCYEPAIGPNDDLRDVSVALDLGNARYVRWARRADFDLGLGCTWNTHGPCIMHVPRIVVATFRAGA